MSVERVNKVDKSEKTQKTDDELRHGKELEIKECEKEDTEEYEKTSDDEEPDDELSIVEFEDPMYELSQTFELEPEYENMTVDQEAVEVQALSPVVQAEYRELSKFHQCHGLKIRVFYFYYISKTLEMIRISFMASLLNAVL